MGFSRVTPYSAAARFKFGDGRVVEVEHAADIKVGIAGRRGASAACVAVADIPAFLRKGAWEALGGQLDFGRDILTVRKRGAEGPPGVNEMGHYVLSAVEFGQGPPRFDRGPNLAASHFVWSFLQRRPDLSDGGLHLPLTEGGLLRFVPPEEFSACTAATSARDGSISGPKEIVI